MRHGISLWNRIAFAALSGAALMVYADAHAQSASAQSTALKEVVVTATDSAGHVADGRVLVTIGS